MAFFQLKPRNMFFSTSRVDSATLPWGVTPLLAYPPELNQNRLEILSGESLAPQVQLAVQPKKRKTLKLSNISKSFMPEKILTILTYLQQGRKGTSSDRPARPPLGFPDWMSPTSAKMLSKSASVTQPPALFKTATRQWQRGNLKGIMTNQYHILLVNNQSCNTWSQCRINME